MSDLPSKLKWSWDITHRIGDEVQFLTIDFSRGMVLVCTEKEGECTLPGTVTSPNFSERHSAELFNTLTSSSLIIWYMRIAWKIESPVQYRTRSKSIVVLEYCEPQQREIAGYEWLCLKKAALIQHYFNTAQAVIRRECLSAIQSDCSLNDQWTCWQNPGWYSNWMSKTQSIVAKPLLLPVKVFRLSHRSAVLRISTEVGYFFLKGSPKSCNDALFTSLLADICPEHCPRPVFIDTSNRVMITSDLGQSLFANAYPPGVLSINRGLDALASIQQKSIAHSSQLLSAGMLDLRFSKVEERILDIVHHPVLEKLAKYSAAQTVYSKIKHIAAHVSAITKNISQALSFAPKAPYVVLHNDLGSNNFYYSKSLKRTLVMDWELSAVGHPFMELSIWLLHKSYRAIYFKKWESTGLHFPHHNMELNGILQDCTNYTSIGLALQSLNILNEYPDYALAIQLECDLLTTHLNGFNKYIPRIETENEQNPPDVNTHSRVPFSQTSTS